MPRNGLFIIICVGVWKLRRREYEYTCILNRKRPSSVSKTPFMFKNVTEENKVSLFLHPLYKSFWQPLIPSLGAKILILSPT